MATPKKRTGKAKQNARRANWKGSGPATTTCKNCNAVILTHTVCPECGYYKNGFASIKKNAQEEVKIENKVEEKVEEVKEEKKARKPRAKKAAAEETVVEEAKAEETEVKAEEATEEKAE